MLKSPPIFTDIKDYKELSIKKGDISVAFFSWAPLIDERCNYNPMIEYVTIRKLKG
jgi:hypothetical protein